MRKHLAAAAAVAVAAPGALLLAALPAQAADEATVSVLHAIPAGKGADVVDVYANGNKIIDDFKPGELKTLQVPAGSYDLVVAAGDSTDASTPVLEAKAVKVPAGVNATVTANLNASGAPALNVFVNDTKATKAGDGRVTVRHIAAAPEVTIKADGADLGNLTNPNQLVADVPAKTYAVQVVPAAGGDPVFSGNLPVTEGVNTIVYAWGDLAGGSFAIATQEVTGLHSSPGGVPAGEAGLATDGAALPAWALGLAAAAALGVAFSGYGLATSRAPRR